MPLCMLSLRPENHKIAWIIVSFVSIDVMNDLAVLERPSENSLGNNAVRMTPIGFLIRGTFPCAKTYCA